MRTLRIVPLLAVLVLVYAQAAGAAVKLWVETAGTMILEDRPAGTGAQIDLSGCRNEFVAAQLGLRADQAGNEVLSFQWTALAGPGGKAIGKENITLFRAANIEVKKGKDLELVDPAKDKLRARVLGKFPDALIPLVLRDGTIVANAIKPEADKTAAFWVDIFLPPGTPAGDYAGKITLFSGGGGGVGGKELQSIPVKVKVFDVDIPADSTIPSIFNLRSHPHVKANIDAYIAEVMRHRIQPTDGHLLDKIGTRGFGWEYIDKFNPDAKGFVSVYVSDTSLRRQDSLLKLLKDATAHLKARGLFDRTYMYMKDEPSQTEQEGIAAVGEAIIKEIPEWKGKLLVTKSPTNTLDPVISYYSCALKCYGAWYYPPGKFPGRPEWDQRRAQGQHLWFYVSNAQDYPYPTFDVQTANMGFEPRVFGWAFWYEKAEGHLYWDLMFQHQWTLSTGFPPGDGELIYPGDLSMAGAPEWAQGKDIKGPVVSRRLKELRQGVQEWELLKMAEKKVGREKAAAIAEKVYRSMGQRGYDSKNPMWSYDESAWDQARQQVIDLLLLRG